MGELEGKMAIVTGSSSGIGRGIARVMAREGADVVVNYRSNSAGAESTAEEIRSLGRRAMVVQADVGRAEDADRLIKAALQAFGRLDILVNNAGISSRKPFLETDEEFFDTLIDTNLKGTYLCSFRAAKAMKEQGGGRIINISSIHDLLTTHDFSLYSATKGGISRLTAGMAIDLADYGITVNAVSPGWIPIEERGERPQKLIDAFCSDIPLGRPGTPEDVGEIVSFLASDRAAWLTGQVIHLDGGSSCMIHMPSRRRDSALFTPEE